MKTTVDVLAPAHDAASLIARLALQTAISADVPEEVRALQQPYPPRRIARALEEAIRLCMRQGRTPTWPPSQQVWCLQTLLLGLLDLADLTLSILSSRAA